MEHPCEVCQGLVGGPAAPFAWLSLTHAGFGVGDAGTGAGGVDARWHDRRPGAITPWEAWEVTQVVTTGAVSIGQWRGVRSNLQPRSVALLRVLQGWKGSCFT